MYLKKLELVGFKSFPEKSAFLFNEGITCIVGPNGCGKTNLLDALRWVLGEQKTSLLRGNKMEEVIFAGTRTLKPLGMAEVSLLLENRHGVLSSQYNELAISRRLYRSGDSEYLLNKTPCRLKDITDLFADTGLGFQGDGQGSHRPHIQAANSPGLFFHGLFQMFAIARQLQLHLPLPLLEGEL